MIAGIFEVLDEGVGEGEGTGEDEGTSEDEEDADTGKLGKFLIVEHKCCEHLRSTASGDGRDCISHTTGRRERALLTITPQ